MFKKLNFPEYKFRIISAENKFMIFDELRKKFVQLTEEEWVRQHTIRYLTDEKNIPGSLIRVESGHKYEKLRKRTDILVFNRKAEPFLIIECKSPKVKIRREVLFQAGIYGRSIQPLYIGVTNGLDHYFWRIDYPMNRITNLDHFPEYS
jgi:hypothetical protein